MSDDFAELDSENETNDDVHSNLISAVTQLEGKQRVKVSVRKEPSIEVSEFHLVKSGTGKCDAVRLDDLANSLGRQPNHTLISKRIKQTISNDGVKTLRKPLEKVEAVRIEREVTYKSAQREISKWNAIVESNRVADTLSFPLNDSTVTVINTSLQSKTQKPETDLEVAVDALLNDGATPDKVPQMMSSIKLSLSDMISRRKELAKLRAMKSYVELKQYRHSKIKSKTYHRILRKEKMKQQLKDFEELKETDPEAALRQLDDLDRGRALERASLRHRNTGKWAKGKALRAKYDTESRKVLAQQLAVSRELTAKARRADSSDEDDEAAAPVPPVAGNNPWVAHAGPIAAHDVSHFYQQYEKYKAKVAAKKAAKATQGLVANLVDSLVAGKQAGQEAFKTTSSLKAASRSEELERDDDVGVVEPAERDPLKIAPVFPVKDTDLKASEDGASKSQVMKIAPVFPMKPKDKQKGDDELKASEGGACKSRVKPMSVHKQADDDGDTKVAAATETEPIVNGNKRKRASDEGKVPASPVTTVNKRQEAADDGDSKAGETSESSASKVALEVKPLKKQKQATEAGDLEAGNETLESKAGERPKFAAKPIGKQKRAKANGETAPVSRGNKRKREAKVLAASGAWDVEEAGTEGAELGKRPRSEAGKERAELDIDGMFDGIEGAFKSELTTRMRRIREHLKLGDRNFAPAAADKDEFSIDEGGSLALRRSIRADPDDELTEGLTREPPVPTATASLVSLADGTSVVAGGDVDPTQFLRVTPKHLHTRLPLETGGGDDALDDEDEAERARRKDITEAFADDDVVTEFAKELRTAERGEVKPVEAKMPGWGMWADDPKLAKQQQRRKRLRKRGLTAQGKSKRRPSELFGVPILYDKPSAKLVESMVRDLPFPFTSVAAYEASLRAPIGRTWVTEQSHRKLTQPRVTTKLGAVIRPMDESALVKAPKLPQRDGKPQEKRPQNKSRRGPGGRDTRKPLGGRPDRGVGKPDGPQRNGGRARKR